MGCLTVLFASDPTYDEDLVDVLDSKPELEVVTARTGEETLEAIDEGELDVLLYGRDLPDLSAERLLKATRKRQPLLPVIYCGEYTVTDDVEYAPTATVHMQRPDAAVQIYERIMELVSFLQYGECSFNSGHDQEMLNRITDGFYALDDAWQFTYVNERAAKFLQRPTGDLVGQNIWTVFPETKETVVYEQFLMARETGETAAFELYYEPLETWFQVTAYPSADGLSVYFRDVTEQMLQTRAMDEAGMGIVITDPHRPDNPIIYANEGFEALTGYASEEVYGRNPGFLQGLRTDQTEANRMRSAIQMEKPCSVELINYRKNGTPFWNRVQITPLFDSNGSVTHYIGFQQDVTARVEEERRAAVFYRVLRHNLRNSMNVILGHLEILEADEDDERLKPVIEHGQSLLQVAHQARHIGSMLEQVRMEPTESVSLEDLCKTATDSVSGRHAEATIASDVAADISVIGSDALGVAIEELLENAAKHTDDPAPQISMTATRTRRRISNDEVRPVVDLSIVDPSPPLSEQDRQVLLGEEETPLQHGSGLGLWLVQWVVTMVGGSITVAEHPGGGNRITITLLETS